MFRWFETRIDPFKEADAGPPPSDLAGFYLHFVRPVWPAFAVLLVAGFLGSAIEVVLFAFIGSLVDMMKASSAPEAFFAEHWRILLFMGFLALVVRPIVSVVHDLIKNQVIATTFTNRIRWQTHRYVLRQSLAFFQNDFAGRIANKIIQTAPALRESIVQLIDALWYASVQFLGAVVLFGAADWRLILPLAAWLAAYVLALSWFVPRIKERATAASEARSMLTGRIVDSYTNALTVKLFAHAEREEGYARAAFREQMQRWQASLRLITGMELVLYSLNGVLIVSASAMAMWLWSAGQVSTGDIAVVIALVLRVVTMSGWVMWTIAGIFENIGVVH
jgi:ATP-binding cassette subfamily B multidrug efflux pump